MRLTLILTFCVFLLGTKGLAQELDGFKYIIVPKKYDFQPAEDKFQLNSLTKFLFNKKGFTALMEGEKQPEELRANPCLGANVNVLESSGMLATRITIELSDCRNQVVFTSVEGKSRIKDLKKGHHDALRKAFRSIQEQEYSFDKKKALQYDEPEKQIETVTEEKEVKEVPSPTEESTAIQEPVAETIEETTAKTESLPSVTSKVEELEPSPESIKSTEALKKAVLYAQEIENGFQLVDSTPKIVFVALKAATENHYYLKNRAGVLSKQGESWIAEYYDKGVLIKEVLNIKF